MTLSNLRLALLRRWYLVLTGVAATVGLCYAATIAVPLSYQAEADVLLLPPTGAGAAAGSNPYLALGGLQSLADVVSRAASDTANITALRQDGVTGQISITRDLSTNGPVILVTAKSPSAGQALAAVNTSVATLEPILKGLQQDARVSPANQATALLIQRSSDATVVRKSQIRAMVVAGTVGAVLTVLAAAATDGLAMRRRLHGRQRPVPDDPASVAPMPRPTFHPPADRHSDAVVRVSRSMPSGQASAAAGGHTTSLTRSRRLARMTRASPTEHD
jgi:hypothetical protein